MADENLQDKNGIAAGTVSFGANGGTIDGYLAKPTDNQPHPGVIMIQEWWGLEPHIKDLTERMAREGYVALAPDLYHGHVSTEPDDAGKQMMALNQDQAVAEIGKAIDYLTGRDDVQPKKVGVTGFCMGGMLCWKVAEKENGRIAAAAPFYATLHEPTDQDIAKITAPMLVVWGTKDAYTTPEQREHLNEMLQRQGKTYKALNYPAGHAFMNPNHGDLEPNSAQQAWGELLAWFKQYVG